MDKTAVKPKLSDILFVDFFNALKTNDYESLGMEEDDFYDLSNEYITLIRGKINHTEKLLQRLAVDTIIIQNTLIVIEANGYDNELIEICKSYGIELYPDNVDEVVEYLLEKHKEFIQKHKVLKGQLPKMKEQQESASAYDILASLGLGLEMRIDFNTFTVIEYISYSKALKKKITALNKQNKKKTYGRT